MGISMDPRFTDNGNGTVTDNMTGLIWLKNAGCFEDDYYKWDEALSIANALGNGSCGLSDGSMAGDWRLPNVRELHSLIDYGASDPALPSGHPFTGVMDYYYWSSTSYGSGLSAAWDVYLRNGLVDVHLQTEVRFVWPVRGGQ